MVFEEVCRQYVLHRWPEQRGVTSVRVGRLWTGDYDVDVVANSVSGERRRTLVGECKWWKSPVGVNVLRELARIAATLPVLAGRSADLALFSLPGFTEEVKAAA